MRGQEKPINPWTRSKALSWACFGLLRRNERAAQKGGHNHLMHRVLKKMNLRATCTTKLDQQSQDTRFGYADPNRCPSNPSWVSNPQKWTIEWDWGKVILNNTEFTWPKSFPVTLSQRKGELVRGENALGDPWWPWRCWCRWWKLRIEEYDFWNHFAVVYGVDRVTRATHHKKSVSVSEGGLNSILTTKEGCSLAEKNQERSLGELGWDSPSHQIREKLTTPLACLKSVHAWTASSAPARWSHEFKRLDSIQMPESKCHPKGRWDSQKILRPAIIRTHRSTLPTHHPAISSCSADTLRAWEKENKNFPKKLVFQKITYNISPDCADRHPRGLHWSQTTLVGDPPQLKLIGCEHDTLQSRLWHQDV